MRNLSALFLALCAVAASPVVAQDVVYEETVVEEIVTIDSGSGRFLQAQPSSVRSDLPRGIASYGPFRVLDSRRAALVDVTNERSAAQFEAMLRAFPGIRTLEMIECPGTDDDRANLRIGFLIHDNGIATHVPKGGSVRSGAVEVFLAGVRRSADPEAEFAVHSWADDLGLEAKDYAPDAPVNRAYIDYYKAMGMAEDEARAFYAMTNSVPNADAKWMTGKEMAQWVRLDAPETVDLAVAGD